MAEAKIDPVVLASVYKTACDAAKLAGAHMKNNLISSKVKETKSSKDDLVTVVDAECQRLIQEHIHTTFPTHDFLGEEDVSPGAEASSQALEALMDKPNWLWIVDPIDGTTNFVHHRPSSVVSIAVAYHGTVVVGVIYDPYREELFHCTKGSGAFCNTTACVTSPVEVSPVATALLGFGIGTKASVRAPMLRVVEAFAAECRGIRVQGSAALELAWVAMGRQTGFYELDLNAWDLAAGVLLVTEAGGKVVGSHGEPYTLRTRHTVATNGASELQQWMLACISRTNAMDPN